MKTDNWQRARWGAAAMFATTAMASSARAGTTIQHVTLGQVTTFAAASNGQPTAVQIGSEIREGADSEIDVGSTDGSRGDAGLSGSTRGRHKHFPNRTFWHHKRPVVAGPPMIPTVPGAPIKAGATTVSFDALNHFSQRFGSSDGNNAFSLEPPDQGLCAGGGFVMEVLNDVLQVYAKDGTPVGATQSLSHFYGYPPAIDRTVPAGLPGRFGPFVTDPSCLYDAQNQRWIVDQLTLDVDSTTGGFTGGNHIDIAVSQTSDPTGAYNIYSIHTEDNGTLGQPDHQCTDGTVPNFCFGDYPHIGLDANGLYITTNEFFLFGDSFVSAQVYALSRNALAHGAPALDVVHIDQVQAGGNPGFTVWPANSNEGDYDCRAGGIQHFLSSLAVFQDSGIDNRIAVWSLSHTSSLDSESPELELTSEVITTQSYAVPPQSTQKAGPTPLADCLNDPECGTLLLGAPDPFPEVEGPLDSNDSRMQEVWFVDGMLMGALDTAAIVGGSEQAGVAWFTFDTRGRHASLSDQGYLAAAGNNLNYPALATLPNGKGVLAFTLVGQDYYPSAGYAEVQVSLRSGHRRGDTKVGAVRVAGLGVGPQDGLTEYQAFNTDADGNPVAIRPRWGDYGAATVSGGTLWFASEYIGQACDLETFASTNFTCGNTRTALGNWGTRVSQISP